MACPAISIRQPWAWAIVAGHKPVENRVASVAGMFRRYIGRRVAIHAAWNMADRDYAEATAFMRALGVSLATADSLFYGGVVGSAEVVEVVGASSSPWFTGPSGVVFARPRQCEFIQCRGKVGVFDLGGEVAKLAFGNEAARA